MQNNQVYRKPPGLFSRGPEPLRVGGARNQHGTRVTRRVTCVSCGEVDYTAVGAGSSPRCRKCAKQELGAFEQSVRVPPMLMKITCFQCKTVCELPSWLAQKEDALCGDCARGFELWRGTMGSAATGELELRRSGTVLRRRVAN